MGMQSQLCAVFSPEGQTSPSEPPEQEDKELLFADNYGFCLVLQVTVLSGKYCLSPSNEIQLYVFAVFKCL